MSDLFTAAMLALLALAAVAAFRMLDMTATDFLTELGHALVRMFSFPRPPATTKVPALTSAQHVNHMERELGIVPTSAAFDDQCPCCTVHRPDCGCTECIKHRIVAGFGLSLSDIGDRIKAFDTRAMVRVRPPEEGFEIGPPHRKPLPPRPAPPRNTKRKDQT